MKESYPTMNKFTFNRRIGAAALALGMLALTGCAALAPATPEQTVEKRATKYWQARIEGKYAKAYALSTPSYRNVRTETQFKTQFGAGVNVQAAEVAKVTCEAVKCAVSMKISVNSALLRMNTGTIATYVDEIWLLEDGQWWHHQDL